MNTSISISVPKPCHEDWNNMTPNEKGSFCGSCQKTVIDFSSMSTEAIKIYLLQNAGKKVCGRFQTKQLDELERVEIPLYMLPRRMSGSSAFLVSLLLVFGTSLFSCTNPEGRTVGELVVVDSMRPEKEVVAADTMKMGQAVAPAVLVVAPVDSVKKVKHPKKKKDPEILKTMGEVEMVKGDVAIEPVKEAPLMGKVCIKPEKK